MVTENRSHATVNGKSRLSHATMRRLRRLGLDRPSSTIIVEDIERLNRNLQRGNYFFADITNEGVLLFNNGRHVLAEACPIDPVRRQQHTQDDFENWFASACGFLKMYDAAMDIENNNVAAFQLHQATERFLNAVC